MAATSGHASALLPFLTPHGALPRIVKQSRRLTLEALAFLTTGGISLDWFIVVYKLKSFSLVIR